MRLWRRGGPRRRPGIPLTTIDPESGDFCIRASGEIFGKPLLSRKTKALIAIAVDVVEQLSGVPFKNHVDIALTQGTTPTS